MILLKPGTGKTIFITLLAMLSCIRLTAQDADAVKWTFTAKKAGNKTYEVHFTPTVNKPWHIYSQTSPEGAGMPTRISFMKNPLVIVDGKTKETGKLVNKYDATSGIMMRYFEGKIDFIQVVKLTSRVKTNIRGTIEYMACSDELCLPPEVVPFNIKLQ